MFKYKFAWPMERREVEKDIQENPILFLFGFQDSIIIPYNKKNSVTFVVFVS